MKRFDEGYTGILLDISDIAEVFLRRWRNRSSYQKHYCWLYRTSWGHRELMLLIPQAVSPNLFYMVMSEERFLRLYRIKKELEPNDPVH